jgi:hypothetical protein
MVEAHWEDLRGREIRYRDRRWELTGDVDVRDRGEVVAAEAAQVDDVRGGGATLVFAVRDPPASLNPGNLGDHFDSIQQGDGGPHLVVERTGRTYRYALRRLEFE